MEKLFTPHAGLMVWTTITFLLMVIILGRFGWGPLVRSLDDRENFLREQKEAAEKSRVAAENLKTEYEKQLAQTQVEVRKMLADASQDALTQKEKIIATAKEESGRLLEKSRRDLANEAERLKGELKSEVAGLAIQMAEKALGQALDPKLQEKVLSQSLKEIAEVKP